MVRCAALDSVALSMPRARKDDVLVACLTQHGALFIERLARMTGLALDDVLVRVYHSDRLRCHNLGGRGANLVELIPAGGGNAQNDEGRDGREAGLL